MRNSNNIEQLENALKHIETPSLDSHTEARMKENVFAQIEGCRQRSASLDELKFTIKSIAQKFEPSAFSTARIKENVMAVVEAASQKDAWKRLFFGWQKILASLMIAVIGITSTIVYIADIPVTKAARKTSFQNLYGTVQVLRNDVMIPASDVENLQEGDVIITGDDGIAVIRYFDDSVTRLSYGTELRIKKLYQYNTAVAETEVGLKLEKGRVWSQVVNLVGQESSFQVETNGMSAVVSTTASFDVKSNKEQEETNVSVFDNTVEVSLYGSAEGAKHLIEKGYVAAVSGKTSAMETISFNDSKQDGDQVWADLNTLKDIEYVENIQDELTENVATNAGVLPGDSLYGAKKLNESAKLVVAGNETNNAKIKVDIAKMRLNEAGALLASGDSEAAGRVLNEFEKMIGEIDEAGKNSDEINNYVKEMIGEASKEVAVLNSDSDLYPLKESLDSVKTKLVSGEIQNDTVNWGLKKGDEYALLHSAATEDVSEQILPEEQE